MPRPNPKLDADGWAHVPGLTRLFESEETAFVPFRPGLKEFHTDSDTGLFGAVSRLSARLEVLLGDYGFQPLPPSTYHVTYADLVCSLDLEHLPGEQAARIEKLLARLPDELTEVRRALPPLSSGGLFEPIVFRSEELEIWGGNALVVKLAPDDATSRQRLLRLTAVRSKTHREWCERYGQPLGPPFTPHCSVGYFRDLDIGERVRNDATLFSRSQKIATEELGSEILRVDRWAVYGFDTMVRLYKPT